MPTSSPLSTADTSSASTYLRSPSAAGASPSNDRNRSPRGGSDCKSGSKSASGAEETPEQLLYRRRTTGSCSFYPSKFKECAEPRNCFDCLNFVVQGEDGGCMLNQYGRCVPVRMEYNASMDFSLFQPANANDSAVQANASRSAGSSGLSSSWPARGAAIQLPTAKDARYQFRADKAEYCNKNDALCTTCRRTVFADFIEGQTERGRTAYCLGEGGCVCIATCEARRDRPPPPNKDCFAKSLAANKKDSKASFAVTSPYASVCAILGAMLFVVVTVFAIYRIRSRGERRDRLDSVGDGGSNNNSGGAGGGTGAADSGNVVATPEAGSSPSNTTMVTVTSTTAGSKLLNLFGWQTMRDDQINKEHLQFAEVEPVKHAHVHHFLGVEPSAPEIDSVVPTAPMAAMAIPVHVPMAVMASAPMVFSVRATASAPDFEDMDDEVFL